MQKQGETWFFFAQNENKSAGKYRMRRATQVPRIGMANMFMTVPQQIVLSSEIVG